MHKYGGDDLHPLGSHVCKGHMPSLKMSRIYAIGLTEARIVDKRGSGVKGGTWHPAADDKWARYIRRGTYGARNVSKLARCVLARNEL